MLTTTNGSALLVDDVYNLVVRPTLALTAAGDPRVTTTVTTSSHTLRVPIMATDPSAAWVAEGAEIPVSPDAVLTELDITPAKLAGLSIVTNELAADSTPEASAQVGMGLARDLARKLDAAFVGNVAAPAPAGLAALSGVQSIVNANAFTNLDVFSQAISLAESVGATTTAFLTGPDTALALVQLKLSTGSNASLLGQDPSHRPRHLRGARRRQPEHARQHRVGHRRRPGAHRRAPGRHRRHRRVGVLHLRPPRDPGDDAGRVRLPAPRLAGQDHQGLTVVDVSVQDVADAIKGGIPPDDAPWVATLIARARRLLARRRPGLDTLVQLGGIDADLVRDTIVAAVVRVVANPSGVYREQEGEYGYSRAATDPGSTGRLMYTADELALLGKLGTSTAAPSIPLVVPTGAYYSTAGASA